MVCVFGAIVFKLKRKVGNFDPAKYMEETAINADFRKVNGMLRLILDCTETQCDEIEAVLSELHMQGKLAFGAHRATHAIMTCVAPNVANNEHVHYIDGSEGGLWSAAKGIETATKKVSNEVTDTHASDDGLSIYGGSLASNRSVSTNHGLRLLAGRYGGA